MKKAPKTIIVVITAIVLTVALVTTTVLAYFEFPVKKSVQMNMTGKIMPSFGRLNASANPTGAWGTTGNPYLISNNQHLINLYTLQNSKQLEHINANVVFQVTDEDGKPCFVGGTSANDLLEIPSIGSEDFPFIANLKGVTTTNSANFVTLPGGEVTDTSAIGNIRVMAYPGQIDIGLFGNVGNPDPNGAGGERGSISNLLLNNVQISTAATGTAKVEHTNHFASATPHESNHIGILAGHAQYCTISSISVYYTQEASKAKVDAFQIDANDATTRYTTAGGIIGYYKQVQVGNNQYPTSSTGITDSGSYAGFGMGIVYSEDIWTFMERNYFSGNPAPQNEYGIQNTFDAKLYGSAMPNKQYFQIGVFTFAHSNQTINTDRIAKLWVSNSKNWSVSTNNSYSNAAQNLNIPSKKYVCKQIQASDITQGNVPYYNSLTATTTTTSNQSMLRANTQYAAPNYRFMIVAEVGGSQYALTRYGYTVSPQKIDTNNFIIPESQLLDYTFEIDTRRQSNNAYPPYGELSVAGYRYFAPSTSSNSCPPVLSVSNGTATSNNYQYNSRYHFKYICYGATDPVPPTMLDTTANNNADTVKKNEAARPLRIYDTLSFMASSSAGSYAEGVHFTYYGTGVNTEFTLKRSSSPNTLTISSTYSFIRFTEADGFTSFQCSTSALTTNENLASHRFKIYAVRITSNPSTPAESPVAAPYEKQIYTPTSGLKTYDMSENVLVYTGNPSSNNMTQKYSYDMKTVTSLSWMDNSGQKVTHADTTLKMGDPTSYYYLNSNFWGVRRGLPAPGGLAAPFNTVDVPLASIGFTVSGHGVRGGADQTAKVFVIVATDPSQLVDQTITISYFPYTTSPANPNAGANPTSFSYSGTRQTVGSFALPPVPGATAGATTPIAIRDNGSTYTAYPNLNTLLVAYELSVPVSRYARTYYLEASKGSANFVYLSAERTAADDNNPAHENDVKFNSTPGVDFVPLRSGRVATVGSANYVQSLTVPYFGLTRNPANPSGTIPNVDSLKVLQAKYFKYNIFRSYDAGQQLHTININATLPSSPATITAAQLKTIMQSMNFNFTEWTHVDVTNNLVAFSDKVDTTINNRAVDWPTIADLYP